jgi:hypothetical protein
MRIGEGGNGERRDQKVRIDDRRWRKKRMMGKGIKREENGKEKE